MGLDNIPKTYPCSTKGTAVKVCRQDRDGKNMYNEDGTPNLAIDCELTMDAGGCPWKNAEPPNGAVYGMFGCPCWYRGKYGEALLNEITAELFDETHLTFYGDNDDHTEKSAESCLALADFIKEHMSEVSDEDRYDDLLYAEWYLRWAAKEADGLVCWF